MPTGRSGALAWTSAIQAPNRQTDRDVGAAGIAHGLLALAAATPDPAARERHLAGARSAGDFLLGASRGGRVPDYVNPDGPAARAYTSFDDGAAGIAEVLWRLGDATGDDRYRAGARDSLRWVLDRAEGVDGVPCPQMCRWAWVDGGSEPPSYRHGMGEGQAGIVYALSVMAERTGDPELAAHAAGGAAYLSSRLDDDGGLPERADEPRRNTGFLSGTAGAAFVFLRMYQATGDERWRRDAEAALGFLDRTAQPAGGGLTWPILLGAGSGALTPDNPNRATGMEEGAAGIGWVSLQAHAILGDPRHLERARGAGRWLVERRPGRAGGPRVGRVRGQPDRPRLHEQRRRGHRLVPRLPGPRHPRRRVLRRGARRPRLAARRRHPGRALGRDPSERDLDPGRRALVALGLRGGDRLPEPARRRPRRQPRDAGGPRATGGPGHRIGGPTGGN